MVHSRESRGLRDTIGPLRVRPVMSEGRPNGAARIVGDGVQSVSGAVRTPVPETSGDRLLRVLTLFADDRGDRGVTDISVELGLDKSVVHRSLTALVRHGFLERDDRSRRYRLGLRTWETGRWYKAHSWVNRLAVPLLAEVVQKIGGTGYVGSLDGLDVVYHATVSGSGPFLVQAEVGSRTSVHSTAMGRAILAELAPVEQRMLLDKVYSKSREVSNMPAPRPRDELEEDLRRAHERGYSVNRGASRPRVGAVGAAIKDRKGRPIGALSIAFPMLPEYEDLWERLPPELVRISGDVSRQV